MPKSNPTCIFESGRIKYFSNIGLLADYLKIDADTVRRWNRKLKSENNIPVKYFGGILIDFNPEILKK